jgi:hypothetical protein
MLESVFTIAPFLRQRFRHCIMQSTDTKLRCTNPSPHAHSGTFTKRPEMCVVMTKSHFVTSYEHSRKISSNVFISFANWFQD